MKPTYNRNYHGPAKFVDPKGCHWREYWPTGMPKPETPNPWLIVAPNLNEKFRTVHDWDDDPPRGPRDVRRYFAGGVEVKSNWRITSEIVKSIRDTPEDWQSDGIDSIRRKSDRMVVMDVGLIFYPRVDLGNISAMRLAWAVEEWRKRKFLAEEWTA